MARFAAPVLALALALVSPSVARAADRAARAEAQVAAAEEASKPAKPKVSKKRAVFYSLLLPGLGQSASGHHGRAMIFYGAEAAIWTTSLSMRAVSNMRFDDVQQYAEINARSDPNDDSDDYYQLLADYDSSDQYNIAIRDEARIIYPDDRSTQLQYIAENSIQGDHGWHWPDYASRRQFQLIRHDALSARRTSLLITGWAVVNRVVSAIEAAKSYPGEDGAADPNTSDAGAGHEGFAFQAGMTSHLGEPAAGVQFVRPF